MHTLDPYTFVWSVLLIALAVTFLLSSLRIVRRIIGIGFILGLVVGVSGIALATGLV